MVEEEQEKCGWRSYECKNQISRIPGSRRSQSSVFDPTPGLTRCNLWRLWIPRRGDLYFRVCKRYLNTRTQVWKSRSSWKTHILTMILYSSVCNEILWVAGAVLIHYEFSVDPHIINDGVAGLRVTTEAYFCRTVPAWWPLEMRRVLHPVKERLPKQHPNQ